MRNRTSCDQVHELPQNDCGDNRESTLFSNTGKYGPEKTLYLDTFHAVPNNKRGVVFSYSLMST